MQSQKIVIPECFYREYAFKTSKTIPPIRAFGDDKAGAFGDDKAGAFGDDKAGVFGDDKTGAFGDDKTREFGDDITFPYAMFS